MERNISKKVAKSMFLSLLPAQIFAVGIFNINGLLNSLIIGNFLGAEALAVFGFMVPINCIHTMIGSGIATGSQILCGRYVGCGDKKSIRGTYAAVVLLCFIIGAILTLCYLLFPVQIASLLGASGTALTYTADYLRSFGLSTILLLIFSSLIPFLQLNNAPNVLYIAIGVMTAINIGGDFLSIFILDGGMYGVGIASVAAYVGSIAVIMVYYFFGNCTYRFSFKEFKLRCIRDIFKLGFPDATKQLCLVVRNFVFNTVAVACGGTAAMSAMAVMNNVSSIATALTGGIEGSTNMSASVFYGERDKETLRDTPTIILKMGVPMQAALYVLIFVLASPIAKAFGTQPDQLGLVTAAIRLGLLYLITNIWANVPVNVYKSLGRTGLVTVATVCTYLIVPISACYILSGAFGINGLWGTFPIPELVTAIGLLVYSAVKRRKLPRKLEDYTYIPESFGIGSEDRCDETIRTNSEVSPVSQTAIDFCRRKGMDSRRAFYCGLCIEELSVAILNHGEKVRAGKGKVREIDLRMIYENDSISILLRDNFPPFDPMEMLKFYEPDDPIRSVGIRMVAKFAKTVEYRSTLNMNVLSIHV